MAVLKCKMCGGDLNIEEGLTVAECEYCGSKQTVPAADNEKKMTLFARANRLRAACEFDKATGVYESIVAEFPEEAEAYWGLLLCKFGIEYVDDPVTGKKIPTCHRSSFDSIMDDSDFEQVMENADAISRRVYREEAKQIEELRKSIIEVSSKEEPYDIFICYKETDENGDRTIDSVIAQDVYDALTEKGYKVFFSRITLEDKLGQEYEPYIFAALNSAKVMLAFGTDYEYYNAVWVKNEWSRYLALITKGEKKTLIPCYKDIDAYDMPKEFKHLQAQDMGKVGATQDLLRGIEKILPKAKKNNSLQPIVQQVVQPGRPNIVALLKRGFLSLEDAQWDKAKEQFDQVLNMDAEDSDAYLGLYMADKKIVTKNAFQLAYADRQIEESSELRRARQYANTEQKSWWDQLDSDRKDADSRKEEQKRTEKEKQRVALQEKKKQDQQKAEEVLAALQAKQARTEILNLENQLSVAMDYSSNLAMLLKDFDGIRQQITRDTAVVEQMDQQLAELRKQRSSLGVFAGKAKKKIDSESEALSTQKLSIETELNNLNSRIGQFQSKELLEHAIRKSNETLAELKKELEEKKSELACIITYEEACNTLFHDVSVAKIVYKKDATAIKNIPNSSLIIAQFDKKASVIFGRFSEDKYKLASTIEWQVLTSEKNRVLLISKYVLTSKEYDENPYHLKNYLRDTHWFDCTLRKWLQYDFLNTSFSNQEKRIITIDSVFLLTAQQASLYYSSNEERKCKKKGKNYNMVWWLRNGEVLGDGEINERDSIMNISGVGVRPALWIDLDCLPKNKSIIR